MQCHQDIILYLSTSTICVTWTTQLVLLGQCIYMVTAQTAISPCQTVLIHHCQLPVSQFNLYYDDLHGGTSIVQETTYCSILTICFIYQRPTILYFTLIDIHISLSTIARYNHCCSLCVMLLALPVFLFCNSLLTGFLSYFSRCYICFCLVSCIVNSVL